MFWISSPTHLFTAQPQVPAKYKSRRLRLGGKLRNHERRARKCRNPAVGMARSQSILQSFPRSSNLFAFCANPANIRVDCQKYWLLRSLNLRMSMRNQSR